MSHPLVQEVAKLSQGFVRRGGKRNRRQQQRRMLTFADHAAVGGTKTLANLGEKQVVNYWKDHEYLSDKTLYNHWCALCALWDLAGKPGKPPRPKKFTKADTAEDPSRK